MTAMSYRRATGFTLVEIAIVLMIVGLLLAGLMPTISSQVEQQRTNETRKTLVEIKESLFGFAMAKGRLPCPADTAANSGLESFCTTDTYPCTGSVTTIEQLHGRCAYPHNGLLPAATLGITPTDNQGYALDGWSNRIRYAVSNDAVSGVSNTFTRTDGMRNVTMANIANTDLLHVCASATGITVSGCGSALNKLTGTAPALIYSTGKNGGYGGAGKDEFANPNPNSANNDRVFVNHTPTPSTATNGEFDDLVIWLSTHTLFNRLVSAGKLP